ncbi:hypothetical protein GETHPA_08920 [Geothrix rubra]|uniref:Uncharacterized protein n=1 Tax=Geothrix rubra TaxID=2927977 RepID=A0ABQ5Q4S6_9BACT|nr:hypothetical protein [Geothrix rubra]GLH69359.1 hypothetical protein GETHPA_08920 [Geothrix rubra]
MRPLTHSLGAAMLALASLGLQAEDFQPLMKVTEATWPEKHHIGVICDYRNSQAEVKALARAAGPGTLITVADTRLMDHAEKAATLLAWRNTSFVVLMPHDRLFRDGSFGASLAVSALGRKGVPAVGTTPVALRQGAVFSVGDGTRGEILVTDRLIGTVDVILPPRVFYEQKVGRLQPEAGSAAITVLSMP